jgi:cyanophycin synthetase
MYTTAHRLVGMTTTEGVYIDGERIIAGDCSGPKSAQAVLLHPRVEVAVLETARGGILREGLAFDSCSVGVVTNISADHLGLGGVQTLEELARVKQVVVEAVRHDGAAVLNADDPLVAEMAAATDSDAVYFSASPRQHVVAAHLAEDGRCVVLDAGTIVLAEGTSRVELIDLERVPFTQAGAIGFQVQNALAATAAAWAAGLNPAMIARALTTFQADEQMAPGRFNRITAGGVEVVLDYGHNTAALEALAQAVLAIGQRRTVLVVGLPGDRRDEDLVATIAAIRPIAETFVLYDLADLRGRAPRELPTMLSQSVLADQPCVFASNQREAIERGWQRVRPGDRLLVIVDEVEAAIEQVQSLRQAIAHDAACLTPIARERVVSA